MPGDSVTVGPDEHNAEGSSGGQDDLPKNTADVLTRAKIGTFRVKVANLLTCQSGRQLSKPGVTKILDSIRRDGWLNSGPILTLYDAGDERLLNEHNSVDLKYRVIDGKHRIAALKEHNKEMTEETFIVADVHRQIGNRLERVLAHRKYLEG